VTQDHDGARRAEGQRSPKARVGLSILWRYHGAALVLTSLVLGAGTWLILGQLESIAGTASISPPPWAGMLLERRPWLMLLALGPAAIGVMLLTARRPRWWWLLVALAMLAVPLALILACFLAIIGPLYTNSWMEG
jgi:hypothetical protein